MSFTTSLSTDIGLVRMELGDDVFGSGVLPNGSNLSDDQVQALLTREGSMMRAVAGACELLATRYAGLADLAVGPRRESLSQIGAAYSQRAESLRVRFGEPASSAAVWSVGVTRVDGYSEVSEQ